ncbi:MAG: redox-sensing transcriptional repressor Rex [Candidatus Omnitrophica bacterium]|nr:redox-sensing transcriptional repressor Rex [Candidatus Omnitrophota bacterium]
MVNKNYIIRLSNYRHALNRFKTLGFIKVFSDNLADATGVTSSQVRKDFSIFGISGNKKGGYQVELLLERLNDILGKDRLQRVIIVGAGKIGKALINYKGFEKDGIKVVAAFDVNTADRVPVEIDVPVYPLEKLKNYVKKNNIEIGVIAVPDNAAQGVMDLLVESGIKGVLNFAPIRLRSDTDTIINNVDLRSELENLVYFVNATGKSKARNNDKGKKNREEQ